MINSKGFTIIELLVSISIIALLSGIVLTNYKGGSLKIELGSQVDKTISDVRIAQNYSLGTREFNSVTPAGGWGVHFSLSQSNQYIIFADINANKSFDVNEEYKRIILPTGIVLSSLVGGVNQFSSADIVFLPPDPQTIINTDNGQINSLNVVFQEKTWNTTKSLLVNFLGLIDRVD